MSRTAAGLLVAALALGACSTSAETTDPGETAVAAEHDATPSPTAQDPACLEVEDAKLRAITTRTDLSNLQPLGGAAYRSDDFPRLFLIAIAVEWNEGRSRGLGVWASQSLEAGKGGTWAVLPADVAYTTWPRETPYGAVNRLNHGVNEAIACVEALPEPEPERTPLPESAGEPIDPEAAREELDVARRTSANRPATRFRVNVNVLDSPVLVQEGRRTRLKGWSLTHRTVNLFQAGGEGEAGVQHVLVRSRANGWKVWSQMWLLGPAEDEPWEGCWIEFPRDAQIFAELGGGDVDGPPVLRLLDHLEALDYRDESRETITARVWLGTTGLLLPWKLWDRLDFATDRWAEVPAEVRIGPDGVSSIRIEGDPLAHYIRDDLAAQEARAVSQTLRRLTIHVSLSSSYEVSYFAAPPPRQVVTKAEAEAGETCTPGREPDIPPLGPAAPA